MTIETDIAIIGGGISGLTASYTAIQMGHSFQLFEASTSLGGYLQSDRTDGFLTEWGATTFPGSAADLLSLCEKLSLKPLETSPKAKKRFIVLNQQLNALPMSPLEAITTPVLTTAEKLRVLQEPFIGKTKANDLSLKDFFTRRLGAGVCNNLLDPFVGGIYAGDIDKLSTPAVFPKLWQWEQSKGSIIKGAVLAQKNRWEKNVPTKSELASLGKAKNTKNTRKGMRLFSFEQGMHALPQALSKALPEESLHLNAPVEEIQIQGRHVLVSAKNQTPVKAKAVILATPAYVSAALMASVSQEASQLLKEIEYNALTLVHLGFDADAIQHPLDGFGALIPQKEKMLLLGSIFASSLFVNRAPNNKILLSNFLGGAHHPEIIALPDEAVVEKALENLATILKPQKPLTPVFQSVLRYNKAIPQYTLGHCQRIEAIKDQLNALPLSRFFLCGNYLDSIALNGCVQSAQTAATQASNALANDL
ncbi:MAG: protoporphyrinogen oxidase [Cyanobacteria bacterium P01_H01_bin.74]